MEKRKIILLFVALLFCVSLIQASTLTTKLELSLNAMSGITQLDNSDGDSVSVSILNSAGGEVVTRNAVVGIYTPDMSIVMDGEDFELDCNTDYTYVLITTYGNFSYNFTTPSSLDDIAAKVDALDAKLNNISSAGVNWTDLAEMTTSDTQWSKIKYLSDHIEEIYTDINDVDNNALDQTKDSIGTAAQVGDTLFSISENIKGTVDSIDLSTISQNVIDIKDRLGVSGGVPAQTLFETVEALGAPPD